MNRFPLPRTDSDAVRSVARRLTTGAAELQQAGRALAAAAPGGAGWQGTASVLAAGEASDLAGVGRQHAAGLTRLADAVTRYASRVDLTVADIRELNRRYEQAAEEATAAVRAAAASPVRSDAGDQAMAALRRTEIRLSGDYERLRERLRRDGADLTRAVLERDPVLVLPTAWQDIGRAAQVGRAALGQLGRQRLAAQYYRWLAQVLRAGRPLPRWPAPGPFPAESGPWVRAAGAGREAGRALDALVHGGVRQDAWLAGPRRAAGKAFLPVTVVQGVRDALNGGGYDGWRGAATQAAGAVGAAGGTALLLGSMGVIVLGPVGAGVATAAVVGYGLWSLGSFVFDHRAALGRFLGRVAGAATRAGRWALGTGVRLLAGGADAVAAGARGLAGGARLAARVATAAADRADAVAEQARAAGRRLRSAVDRLGDTSAGLWSDAVERMGAPLTVPARLLPRLGLG